MPIVSIILLISVISTITLAGSFYARKYSKPDLLIGIYITFVLLSQILAVKISSFIIFGYSFFVPSAVLVFSVTYLLTDIVNEKFGRQETHRMIFIALVSQMISVFFLWIGTILAPAPFWNMQEAWKSIFSIVGRITLASWIAFIVSENFDALVFSCVKDLTKGKHLWLRNVVSSLPALFLDSIIFVPLAFAGSMPLLPLIIGQIVLKWLVGLVNIPFMYLNKNILTKK